MSPERSAHEEELAAALQSITSAQREVLGLYRSHGDARRPRPHTIESHVNARVTGMLTACSLGTVVPTATP